MEVKAMENGSSVWKLCMILGVVGIALAGFMNAALASPPEGEDDSRREVVFWSRSEDTSSKISPSLVLKMNERQIGDIAVIIEMKEQQKASFNVREAKMLAAKSQTSLAASLEKMQAKNIKPYWIANAVSATVPVQNMDAIAARQDVKMVYPDESIKRIETASATSGPGQDGNMVANPIPDDSGYLPNRIINYTSTSSVGGVGASGYTTTMLYLRPDLTGPPYSDYLSEECETSGGHVKEHISGDGDYLIWGNYTLKEDIHGTLYSYWVYFASESSATFEIEILINGTTVAAFSNLTVLYDPYYLPFSEEVTGLDPTTADGDEVVLKITKVSGGNGSVLFGTGADSHIALPSIDIADYGDDIINAPLVWNQGYDGSEVNISILDTGIDDTHPDLVGKVIAEEDFTNDGTTDDLHGHGTHCAGIAAGKYNTATNVTGVAPGATLINAKVLNATGYGNTSWILSGIEWSIDRNVDIMSMSFGDWQKDGTGRDLESMAVTNAVNAGYVVVVAAGNAGPAEATIGLPPIAHGAIAVAASDSNDAIVDFSSRGPTGDGRVGIDVAAPGYKIIAPNAFWEGGVTYVLESGTSMSCPHVAGAAALLLQANPGLTPEKVERALKNGADDIADNIADDVTGVTAGSKVLYYAFDVDDIDNSATLLELIENSENWLRVVENPTRSVLIIDDDNDIHSDDDQSADMFQSAFEGLGYAVTNESSDETSCSTWNNYDIVVWSCGDDATPIYYYKYKKMLIDYVDDGGHLLLESGEIVSWIKQHGGQVIDRELREKVLHATADWVYSDVGDLTISIEHPVATTPNLLPKTVNFTPTAPGDNSGDADAVRILPDAAGICNWSSVAYGGSPITESVARISYSLIAYELHENDADAECDVWEQGSGRLDIKDAYDVLTKGIMVDSQWIVGNVHPGSYTKRFTVVNNDARERNVHITRSTRDAGDWITLPENLTVPAGGIASFDAVMDLSDDAMGAYKGSIRVNDGIEEIIIPVSVNVIWDTISVGCITGSVDTDCGGYFPSGDWVYYTLDVPVTTHLNLCLDWTNSNNDLDLWLFNPGGTLTDTSFYDKPEMITVDNPLAGYWTVAINAWKLQTAQETYALDISVSGEDTIPPSVTCPSATPESIVADGIRTTRLNVTVTDNLSGVGVVTVDLSAIGGSPTHAMTPIAGDVYTTTTTVAVGTEPATYCLSVDATDNFGNSNTTRCIILDVAEPIGYGVDLNVDVMKQTVAPEENATYVMTVLNTGGQHDRFTLNITINEADAGELSKTFVSLAPGASETVHLIVSDSTGGVYNTTIEAVLEGDPSKKDVITVETTVETEAVTIIAIDDAIASTGGDDAVTPVVINNVVNAGVVCIDIYYDPSVVRVVDVVEGDFDFTTSSIDNTAGVVRVGAMQVASSGLNGDVLLADVTLQAKGGPGNTSTLSIDINELKDATPQCNPIHAGVEDGIFTVSCLCGDVNGDGDVLLDDAIHLMKHCAREPGFEQINECASDVGCDGVIGMADAMYLAKHCVGVPGFEKLHCCAGQQ